MSKRKSDTEGQLVPVDGQPGGGALVPTELYTPPGAEHDESWRRALAGDSDSERELLLVRWLTDRAVREGASPSMVAQLTALASKLVETVRAERDDDHKRIEVDEIKAYARELSAIVREVLERHSVPNFEMILDEIGRKIADVDPANPEGVSR
jgi:hypothetical protein